MVTYRLQRFPEVCAHCWKPDIGANSFLPVTSYHDSLGCTIEQKCSELIRGAKHHDKHSDDMVPCKICRTCLETLVGFHQYQRKLECIRKFNAGLVALVQGNLLELMELYTAEGDFLVQLLKTLDVCHEKEENVSLDKLIEDLPSFEVYRNYHRPEYKVMDQITNIPNVSHQEGTENMQHANTGSVVSSLNLARNSSLISEIKVEDTCIQEDSAVAACMPHASELCDSPDIKNSYPLHTIANSSENGESSSMQRFPSRSGMELEKRYDHEERLESFLKYKYESESEEDDPLEMEKSHNRQTNTIARRSKYKPRKRYGHRDPDIFSSKMQLESDVRKYPCPECPLSFKTGYHLKRHHATIHQDQRFPCNVCQTSYGRREKLRAHMELVHQIQSYFVCDICLVSYESSDLLQRHVYRHQHPKPLECGTCFTPSVRLADESYSSNHICITYQDSYECCGKDFGFHYYYNRHMLTAHNIKTNARVKLPKGTLLSQFRALRSAKV